VCHDAASVKLIGELCSIATAVLEKASDSRAHFEVAFVFVGNFVTAYGADVETGALATLAGTSVQDHIKELGRLLESLILGTVAAVQENLGNVWTSPSEQGNGEEAFERKPSPVKRPHMKSNESLAGILLFLTKALGVCPVFLLHLPAGPGKDREDDKLLRRAVDSAVVSLNDDDPEIVRNSIAFLEALVRKCCFVSLYNILNEHRTASSSRSMIHQRRPSITPPRIPMFNLLSRSLSPESEAIPWDSCYEVRVEGSNTQLSGMLQTCL